VFAAGIVAEIGDITYFPDDDRRHHRHRWWRPQFAGLTWPPDDSGQHTSDAPPWARTGNASLRPYRVEAANSVRRHDARYAASYQRKWADGTQPAHHRALLLTARTRTRRVLALLGDDRAYDPARRPVRRRRHG
jgi:hypothetical protein